MRVFGLILAAVIWLAAGRVHAAPVCSDAFFVCTYTQMYIPSQFYPQLPATGTDYAIDKVKNFHLIVTDKAVYNWYAGYDGKLTLWDKLKAQNPNQKILLYQNGFPLYTVTSGGASIGKTQWSDYISANPSHGSIGVTHKTYLRHAAFDGYENTRIMNIGNTGWIDYWAAKSSMAEMNGFILGGVTGSTSGAIGVFADNVATTAGRAYRHTPNAGDGSQDIPANEDCPNEYVTCDGFNAGSGRPAAWWSNVLAAINRVSLAFNGRNEHWVFNGGGQTLTQVGGAYWSDLEAVSTKPLGLMCEGCFVHGGSEFYIDELITGWERGMSTTLNVINDNTANATSGGGVLGSWANPTQNGRIAEGQLWYSLTAHKLADGTVGNDRQHWHGFVIDQGAHWNDVLDPAYVHLGKSAGNYFRAKVGTNVYCREFTDGWMCLNGRNRSPDQSLPVSAIPVPTGAVCVVKYTTYKNANTPGQNTNCDTLKLATTSTTWDIGSFEAVILLKSTRSLTNSDNPSLPAGCDNEAGLAGRTDVLKCEPWESSTWWQNGWYRDQGNTGQALDGRRFYQFPVDQAWIDNGNNPGGLTVVNTGCLVGSCLRVKMGRWQDQIGSYMAQSWIIPGLDGCSHSTIGCVPQQEVFLRYYMKLSPNFDPENYWQVNGTPLQGGGKFPGLADAINGASGTPSIQCGNGGEGPTNGTECWSARLGFFVPYHSDNGTRYACTENGIYTCSMRLAYYPYMYVPLQPEGSRYTAAYWDGFYSPSIDFSDPNPPNTPITNGQCSDTYGFECGIGTPGLINNKWYLVELRIKMNTPGQANGVMQAWLDGELRYNKTNANFRNVGHNNVGIRQAWFDVFAGGDDVGMKEDMYIMFDQMVVSTAARPGPWTGDIRGNVLAVNGYTGTGGFNRSHYLSNVLPSNGGCYLQIGGAGSVTSGDNSIKCTNYTVNGAGGIPGVTTALFSGNASGTNTWPGKCDNFASFYWPHLREWWKTGCSYAEPDGIQFAAAAVPSNTGHAIISARVSFANCVSSFTTDCATVAASSRWNVIPATAAGSEWDNAFAGVVKNANFRTWWKTDNGAAVNPHIRTAIHGHGYSNNGDMWAVSPNLASTLCIPSGQTPSGAEALIHCQLTTNPKQLPIYTDGSCGDQPIGSGTTPGIRRQMMGGYAAGPYDSRAFYIIGSRAEENCAGLTGSLRSRDFWVMGAAGGVLSFTQLAPPPTISDTPLIVYNSERNEIYAQMDNKIYRYPLFGENTWYDATPSAGLGFSCFNMYGAYDAAAKLFVMHDGNNTDVNQGSAGCQGIKAFSMENAVVLTAPTVGFAATSSQGSEATTPVLIPVTLINPPATTVTVDYAVAGGTATGGGSDYTLNSGQLSFSGGTVTQNITVSVVNDAAVEPNETIIITLSNPTGGALLGQTTHTYTINNDDSAPAGMVRAPAVILKSGEQRPLSTGKSLTVQ